METTRLGMPELEVSRIAFGTWQIGGEWGEFDRAEAVAAIRHARVLGIDFFDTALAYGFGASERLLGEALRDDLDNRRDEVAIATKGGLRMDEDAGLVRDSSPEWLRSGVDHSLSALGVDHIDLYQVHWPDPDTPISTTSEGSGTAILIGGGRRPRDLDQPPRGGSPAWMAFTVSMVSTSSGPLSWR